MTLKPCLHGINKRISNKLFMLRTICKYLNYDNSILVYKQTIMTIFDYSGFMLFSLDVKDKRDLRIRKNDVLRFCYNVKLMNHVSIVDLQELAQLSSPKQRRIRQWLGLQFLLYVKGHRSACNSGQCHKSRTDTKIGKIM